MSTPVVPIARRIPVLGEDGKFPDEYAPASVAQDAADAKMARQGAEAARNGMVTTGEVVDGDLILTRVDGEEINAGTVRGADGARGADGPRGADGARGPQGDPGPAPTQAGYEAALPPRLSPEGLLGTIGAAVTDGVAPKANAADVYSKAAADTAFAPSIPRTGQAIARRLKDQSQATVIGLVGDSTGDETTEWFEQTIVWLGQQAPNVPVKVMRWNDAAQGYGLPQRIQTGAVEASLAFTGAHYVTLPDAPEISLTGDMTAVVDVALADWTPTNNPALITKFGLPGQRSFRLYVEAVTGLLVFAWYPDGTNSKTVKSSVAPTVADGARLRVAVELDVDDGAGNHAVRFYVGSGTNGWSQLGTTQMAAGGGTTSVFDSTTNLSIGSRLDNGVDNWTGTLWSGALMSGSLAGGRVVAGYDPGMYPAQQGNQAVRGILGGTWSPVGVPAITYAPMLLAFNGSKSNMTIAYSADDTRLALQTPIEPQMFFISYGHNQTSGALAEWDALATKFRTRYPLCPVVAVAQSPQKAPRLATQIARQAQIASEVSQIASLRNYDLVNAFAALSEDTANYVMSDGVHPTLAGSTRWSQEARKLFLPWPVV